MSSSTKSTPPANIEALPFEKSVPNAKPDGGIAHTAAASAAPRVENYVGTLVGESTSGEFRLALAQESVREQDLIAVDAELRKPGEPDGSPPEQIRVWAKVRRTPFSRRRAVTNWRQPRRAHSTPCFR